MQGIFTLDNDNNPADGPQYVNVTLGGNRITVLEDINMEDDGNILSLALALPAGTSNLNNYTGGAICNATSNCGEVVSYYLPVDTKDPVLNAGITAAAPEPGTARLLSAGLSAMTFPPPPFRQEVVPTFFKKKTKIKTSYFFFRSSRLRVAKTDFASASSGACSESGSDALQRVAGFRVMRSHRSRANFPGCPASAPISGLSTSNLRRLG